MGEAATYQSGWRGSASPLGSDFCGDEQVEAHLRVDGADVPDDQDARGDLGEGRDESTTTRIANVQTKRERRRAEEGKQFADLHETEGRVDSFEESEGLHPLRDIAEAVGEQRRGKERRGQVVMDG